MLESIEQETPYDAVWLNMKALEYRLKANASKVRFAIYRFLDMLIEALTGVSFMSNTRRLRLNRVQRRAEASNPESKRPPEG